MVKACSTFTQVKLLNTGGKQQHRGKELVVEGADEVLIFISTATDFRNPQYRSLVEKNMRDRIAEIIRCTKANACAQFQEALRSALR